MEKKYLRILVVFTTILLCTTAVFATTVKYDYDDSSISYEEYLNHNQGIYEEMNGQAVIGLLCRKYNIKMDNIRKSTITPLYYSHYWPLAPVTRMQALIDIMRVNMLIPDPETVTSYIWNDLPQYIDDMDLAYINYAKELGITNGIEENAFGFNKIITYYQFDKLINNIKSLENLESYQVKCPIKVIDRENQNHDILAAPIITEYLYTIPDKLVNKLKVWSFYLDGYYIPNYDYAVGLTSDYDSQIDIISYKNNTYATSFGFNETMIHEFGHAFSCISGIQVLQDVDNGSHIIEEEIPKLAEDYRTYAASNRYEYFACAWVWLYTLGDENFKSSYPYTYAMFQKMLSLYQ